MSFRPPYSITGPGPGRLIRVDIEQPTATQSATGQPATTWGAFAADVPARIRDVSGLERYAEQAIQGIARFDLLLRYLAGVTERMRVKFTNDGRAYILDIETASNIEMKNRWLMLRCKSGVNRG